MSELSQPSFDLVHQPWLTVRGLDGRTEDVGILRALGTAHELAGLSGEVPTQTFALTRLLLAVLHGALAGPADLDDWAQLWEAEKLPVARIAPYLAQHCDRFDLFHPRTPFLQVADLHRASGGGSGLSKVIADVPDGAPVFTTRLGGGQILSHAEAARWLVHCQAFDTSGIKSGAVGDDRVKGGKGYPLGVAWAGLLGGVLLEGVTLKETLLLNLIAADFADRDPELDVPAWERPPVTAAEELPGGRPPDGPVDLYTWQSRRIRLLPAGGRVPDVLVCYGERCAPQNKHTVEPHTAWRRSPTQEKKLGVPLVYMPREHDPERAIWRGLASLLPGAEARQSAEAAPALPPVVLAWLGRLTFRGPVARDHPVRVRAIGMVYGSQSSVVDDVVDDTIALRAILATQDAQALVEIAVASVREADAAARTLGNLAGDLVSAAGGDGAGRRARAIERIYAELDGPFRSWLIGLGPDTDPVVAHREWHHTARKLVVAAAQELQREVSPAAWEGREVRGRVLTAAHAVDRFWRDLRAALPLAVDQPDPVPA